MQCEIEGTSVVQLTFFRTGALGHCDVTPLHVAKMAETSGVQKASLSFGFLCEWGYF